MIILYIIIILISSYLIGAIPFGLLVVRFKSGKDIRQIESGAQGDHAFRAAGFLAGATTALLDGAKAAGAVWIARILMPGNHGWKLLHQYVPSWGIIILLFGRTQGKWNCIFPRWCRRRPLRRWILWIMDPQLAHHFTCCYVNLIFWRLCFCRHHVIAFHRLLFLFIEQLLALHPGNTSFMVFLQKLYLFGR